MIRKETSLWYMLGPLHKLIFYPWTAETVCERGSEGYSHFPGGESEALG